jgi:hypothetical protein
MNKENNAELTIHPNSIAFSSNFSHTVDTQKQDNKNNLKNDRFD